MELTTEQMLEFLKTMKETTDASQARMLAKMDEIIEDMRAW
jgi:hypothetical protein